MFVDAVKSEVCLPDSSTAGYGNKHVPDPQALVLRHLTHGVVTVRLCRNKTLTPCWVVVQAAGRGRDYQQS